jgi:hypothetical protein
MADYDEDEEALYAASELDERVNLVLSVWALGGQLEFAAEPVKLGAEANPKYTSFRRADYLGWTIPVVDFDILNAPYRASVDGMVSAPAPDYDIATMTRAEAQEAYRELAAIPMFANSEAAAAQREAIEALGLRMDAIGQSYFRRLWAQTVMEIRAAG